MIGEFFQKKAVVPVFKLDSSRTVAFDITRRLPVCKKVAASARSSANKMRPAVMQLLTRMFNFSQRGLLPSRWCHGAQWFRNDLFQQRPPASRDLHWPVQLQNDDVRASHRA